jgi:hypothetical protein
MRQRYKRVRVNGRNTAEHILIAEKILGRPLKGSETVHHVDDDGFNNKPDNMVLCPNQQYHMLLHMRQRAFDACGHYDWRKCVRCKIYDSLNNLRVYKKVAMHSSCNREYTQGIRNGKELP